MRLTNKQVEILSEEIYEKVKKEIEEFNSIHDTAPFDKTDPYFNDYEFVKKLEKEIEIKRELIENTARRYINKEHKNYKFSPRESQIFTEKSKKEYIETLQGKKKMPSLREIEKALILSALNNPNNIIETVTNQLIK